VSINLSSANERYLRFTYLGLLALFPILTATVKDAGSIIFILLLLPSLALAWPGWTVLQRREKQWLLGYVMLFAVSVLSMVNTEDMENAAHKLERLVRLLALIPVYLTLRRLRLNAVPAFSIGAALACVVMAVLAFIEHSQTGLAVHGAYHKIIYGDVAMLMAALVAAALMTMHWQRGRMVFAVLCVVLGVSASIYSQTRGAWLLIPVLVPIWLFLFRHILLPRQWAVILGSLVAAVLILSIWTPASIERGIQSGVSNLEGYIANPGEGSSWGARINMWRDSLTLWQQNPLFGAGLGDFKVDRERLMESGLAYSDHLYGHAHSIFFDALATTGALGFVALLLSVFVLPWRCLYPHWLQSQEKGWQRMAMFGGMTTLIAFFVFGLTEGWTSRNPFLNTYALTLMVFISGVYIDRSKEER